MLLTGSLSKGVQSNAFLRIAICVCVVCVESEVKCFELLSSKKQRVCGYLFALTASALDVGSSSHVSDGGGISSLKGVSIGVGVSLRRVSDGVGIFSSLKGVSIGVGVSSRLCAFLRCKRLAPQRCVLC